MQNPFENALEQLRRAARAGEVPANVIERMSVPEREITVSVPVVMDTGETRLFEGYRVQHSSLRGPHKGGIRFHPKADINEVRALALWMTLKTSVADIPMGGGKGGITVDPKALSSGELERLSRGFVRMLYRDLGPKVDVPAPDVNTTPEIMSWMVSEYEKLTGDTTRATFTGKPVDGGGSLGRGSATGLGGFYVFNALRARLGLPEKCTVAVQGMGNVGGTAARILSEAGHTVVAISDSRGGVYKAEGIDVSAVEDYKHTHGSLAGYPDAVAITNAELLLLPCDVLIPAALENQITDANVNDVQAKAILELANGPTTPEADDRLFARGIHVIPDILANAGGVIVSYFEWKQNLTNETWTEEDVNARLKDILDTQSVLVHDEALTRATDLRRAAFLIALLRLKAAMEAPAEG
ncbi:MAG TPA: Glu/Leu/Phe/Val dehydrogenase [Candidatus Paceibacterota bacterium]|jgi:glutamate dehydrogenase/leucine dehydrogenase